MDPRLASLAGLLIVTAALIALLLEGALLASGTWPIAFQVLSALLMLWARMVFGRRSFHAAANPTEGGLVRDGPYRYIPHPIYAAVIYFFTAGVATHPSPAAVILGAVATLGLSIRIIAEERLVAERYPEYRIYAARTKRIIPFVF